MKHMPLSARFEKLCPSLPERAPRDLGLYGHIFSGKNRLYLIEHFNHLERDCTFLQNFSNLNTMPNILK